MATILDETEGEYQSWRSEIAIWDTGSKLAVGRLSIPGAVQARFIGAGEVIAVGEVTGHLSFWSTTHERQLLRVRPSLRPLSHLAVSGDATLIAASDGSKTWLWNLETGTEVGAFEIAATALGQAENGADILAVDGIGAIFQLSIDSPSPENLTRGAFESAVVETSQGEITQIARAVVAPGPTAAIVDNALSPNDSRYLNVYRDGFWTSAPLPDAYYSIFSLEISPAGDKVLLGTEYAFSLYDTSDLSNADHYGIGGSEIAGGQSVAPKGLTALDTLTFFGDDGHVLAVGNEGNPIVPFDIHTGATSAPFGIDMKLPTFGMNAAIAGHKVFYLTWGGNIEVFDLTTGKPGKQIPASDLPSVDYEPHGYLYRGTDGKAYYEYYDGPGLRIDPETMRTTRLEPSQTGDFARREQDENVLDALKKAGLDENLLAVASPSAGVVMVLSSSGLMYLLDAETGARLATLAFFNGGDWAVATDIGFFDGTLAGMRALSVVEQGSARPVAEAIPRYHRPDLVRAVLTGDAEVAIGEAARLQEEALAASNPAVAQPVVIETSAPAKAAPKLPGIDLNTAAEVPATVASDGAKPQAPSLPGLAISTEGTD